MPLDKLDIKLTVVHESSGDEVKLWSIFLKTNNKEQVIGFDGEERSGENPTKREVSQSDSTSITFTNSEIANRVKAAINHASALCSKHTEPF